MNLFARAWREQPRGGAVDEVVDDASVMELAASEGVGALPTVTLSAGSRLVGLFPICDEVADEVK
ncbi:hypothetical protein T492DRAFT_866311 [Pavlovales sp. CCMP2436]|nr:hypothetical protein T492DRAFT_866311 [Pavlovales sp. CCMP2436]